MSVRNEGTPQTTANCPKDKAAWLRHCTTIALDRGWTGWAEAAQSVLEEHGAMAREIERLRSALTWIAENGPPAEYERVAREALSGT